MDVRATSKQRELSGGVGRRAKARGGGVGVGLGTFVPRLALLLLHVGILLRFASLPAADAAVIPSTYGVHTDLFSTSQTLAPVRTCTEYGVKVSGFGAWKSELRRKRVS